MIIFHLRKTPGESYYYQSHSRDEENEAQRSEEVFCEVCQRPAETRMNLVHPVQSILSIYHKPDRLDISDSYGQD